MFLKGIIQTVVFHLTFFILSFLIFLLIDGSPEFFGYMIQGHLYYLRTALIHLIMFVLTQKLGARKDFSLSLVFMLLIFNVFVYFYYDVIPIVQLFKFNESSLVSLFSQIVICISLFLAIRINYISKQPHDQT
jgi:hypothetical protein